MLHRINDLLSKAHEILLHPRLYHIIMVYDQEVDILKIYRLSSTRIVGAQKYVELVVRVKVTGEVEAKVIDDEIADAIEKGYVRRTIISREFFECTCEAYRFRKYCRDMVIALTLYHYIKTELSEKIDPSGLQVTRLIIQSIQGV